MRIKLTLAFVLLSIGIVYGGTTTCINIIESSGSASCSETPTTELDTHNNSISLGNDDNSVYVGSIVSKAGGYTDICSIILNFVASGTISGKTYQIGKATMTGDDINTFTAWESFSGNDAWSQTDYEITIDPPQSVSQNEAIVVYISSSDGSNYLIIRTDSGQGNADLGDGKEWGSDKALKVTQPEDFRIEIYEME
jgi:hypothetical protein